MYAVFRPIHPNWRYRYDIHAILTEIIDAAAWKLKCYGILSDSALSRAARLPTGLRQRRWRDA